MATLLIVMACVPFIQGLTQNKRQQKSNPYSDISSHELSEKIKKFAKEEGWVLIGPSDTEVLASEAISYEGEVFKDVDRVLAFRTNSMTVIVWIIGQDGSALAAHVRKYASDYDLSYEKLFNLLRTLVPFSSAGGPPLEFHSGAQGDVDQPAAASQSGSFIN